MLMTNKKNEGKFLQFALRPYKLLQACTEYNLCTHGLRGRGQMRPFDYYTKLFSLEFLLFKLEGNIIF